MIDLLREIEARVAAILTGELFDDPAGGSSEPMVLVGGLDPKRSGQKNEEDFPFVVIRPLQGGSTLHDETETVQIIAGIFTAGDVLSGITEIDRMKELLGSLAADRVFTPYLMEAGMKWQWGENKTGHQPHPYYYLTIQVPFKRAPRRQ